jgi:hypothetical protein
MRKFYNPTHYVIETEVRDALEKQAYMPALALALTIPDVYGQLEYPCTKSTREYYRKWCSEFCSFTSELPHSALESGIPAFTSWACYKLRCQILHSGNSNLTTKDLIESLNDRKNIDKADEIHNSDNTSFEIDIGRTSSFSKTWLSGHEDEAQYKVAIGLEQLCTELCIAADYYKKIRFDIIEKTIKNEMVVEDYSNV